MRLEWLDPRTLKPTGVRPDIYRKCGCKSLKYWKKARPGKSAAKFYARKKLDPDRPSNTQASRPHYHWAEPREMSIIEQAVLQSFPPQFKFPASFATATKLIGNSVPPLLMWAIACKIKELLAQAERDG